MEIFGIGGTDPEFEEGFRAYYDGLTQRQPALADKNNTIKRMDVTEFRNQLRLAYLAGAVRGTKKKSLFETVFGKK